MIHLFHRYGPWTATKAKRRDIDHVLRKVEVRLCGGCGRSKQRLAGPVMVTKTAERGCGADFSGLLNHLGANLVAHARRDGLSPVQRAVFLDRGGHAPGEACPTEPPREPEHAASCSLLYDGDDCDCGALAEATR